MMLASFFLAHSSESASEEPIGSQKDVSSLFWEGMKPSERTQQALPANGSGRYKDHMHTCLSLLQWAAHGHAL